MAVKTHLPEFIDLIPGQCRTGGGGVRVWLTRASTGQLYRKGEWAGVAIQQQQIKKDELALGMNGQISRCCRRKVLIVVVIVVVD